MARPWPFLNCSSRPRSRWPTTGSENITIQVTGAAAENTRRQKAAATVIRVGDSQPGAKLPKLVPFDAAQVKGQFSLDAYLHRGEQTNHPFFTWPLNVAVNLFDDDTWFENARTVIDQARTVRDFAPGARQRLVVSLHAPYARTALDQRGQGQFAAAWAVTVMANLVRAGVDEAMFDLSAERPQSVLQRLEKFAGRPVLYSLNSDGSARPRVESLALRDGQTTTVFLANLTGQPQEVRLHGLRGETQRYLSRFDAKTKPDSSWPGKAVSSRKDAVRVKLAAYEICELTAPADPLTGKP